MKSFLFFLWVICATFTLTTSCNNPNGLHTSTGGLAVAKDNPEYPKPFEFKGGNAAKREWKWQIIKGQDEHEYLENNRYYSYVCIHYIDCKLCAQRDSIKNLTRCR